MDTLTIGQKLQTLEIERRIMSARYYKSDFSDESIAIDLSAIDDEIKDLQWALYHIESIHGVDDNEK